MNELIATLLMQTAQAGTFLSVVYDEVNKTKVQGSSVSPQSVAANEISTVYKKNDTGHGRSYINDRAQWLWELEVCFSEEVIDEPFVQALLDSPLRIAPSSSNGLTRGVIINLVSKQPAHPPRQGASNGSEFTYRFSADVCKP